MREVIGRVAAINRYPVKSMQGEQPDEVTFDGTGMVGDRRWAVLEASGARALSAKRVPALLDASAASDGTDDGRPSITLPSGRILEAGDPDTDAALSEWLGRDVVLGHADPTAGLPFEMSFDEDGEVFEISMPAGRFVDFAPVHVLTTASIAVMAALHPDGNWNPNRFRPGILIETDPSTTGLIEDGWTDGVVQIGAVGIEPIMPTMRCIMTTRAQRPHGIERDLEIVKTINANNASNLGLSGSIGTPGTVRVGDPVTVT